MIFKQTSRESAEKVFISVYNLTGAALSAGVPVEWDVATNTDGVAVTGCKSGAGSLAGLFVGLTDAALADSAYGLVQVYGFRTSAYIGAAAAHSAGLVPGDFLKPVGQSLQYQTMSAATTSGHEFVCMMETVAATAGLSTQIVQKNVFIRAL